MNIAVFKNFFRSEATSGVILIFCVVVSLVIANSTLGEQYSQLLSYELGFEDAGLKYPVLLWINDGLMAIFFLMIGLEIKRELVEGELSSVRKAALPVFAAVGGAIVPAAIFHFLNNGQETESGWGIPMATDIAFALGILALLGKRVPATLKIFLAALAIADDLIAILVIAIFYSASLNVTNLLYAGSIFLLLIVFNRLNIKSLWLYVVPGLFIWYFIHHSGVHATIAGVITAFTLPTTPGTEKSPLEKLEHILHKPVNFFIMPLFALANTNIHFAGAQDELIRGSLGMGIIVGLLVGKPIGIMLTSWLTVKMKWGALPSGTGWKHIFGVGLLGGIGFTMSIFIALLSFSSAAFQSASKVAILIASATAGTLGFLFLLAFGKKKITASSQSPG
jgi:NhaA family Na+:H+ antiporter